jgi:hypothetical protein
LQYRNIAISQYRNIAISQYCVAMAVLAEAGDIPIQEFTITNALLVNNESLAQAVP